MEIIAVLLLLIFAVLGVFLYGLPSIIAYQKENPNKVAILMLNLFLGWTLLGWVICLVWACLNTDSKTEAKTVTNEINLSVADEIKKLAQLKEQGVLTDDEFQARKKQILENG